MARTAQAVWNGTLKEGVGAVKLGSGAFDGAYSFLSRFEEGTGTNPEELLGAAHAGCFSMALANSLSGQGFTVHSIDTTAHVHLERGESGLSIARIDLVTKGHVEGIDAEAFAAAAEATKDTCIISRALGSVPMTVAAELVS